LATSARRFASSGASAGAAWVGAAAFFGAAGASPFASLDFLKNMTYLSDNLALGMNGPGVVPKTWQSVTATWGRRLRRLTTMLR
jgi:hypothetical protein